MSKLIFKRVALVVVSTLGLGVLSSGPSQSAVVPSSDTLTVSSTSSTIAAGETASVTVTQTFIASAAADSLLVRVSTQTRPEGGNGSLGLYVTDSSNVSITTTAQTVSAPANGTDFQSDYFGFNSGTGVAGTAVPTPIYAAAGLTASAAGTAVLPLIVCALWRRQLRVLMFSVSMLKHQQLQRWQPVTLRLRLPQRGQ